MVNYRRDYTKEAMYFFTVALHNRRASYLTDHIGNLKKSFQKVHSQLPFETCATVILPEHLHTIWKLPDHDYDYSTRWRLIKTNFTKDLNQIILPNNGNSKQPPIWQSRFWEHRIRDNYDLQAHVDYIHYNPVKHGYCSNPKDWEFSSLHRFIRLGICSKEGGRG